MCVQWVEKEVWTGLSNSAYAHISKTTRILHIELNIFAPIYSIAISDHSMQTAFSHCVSILHFWLLRERARCTRQCKIKCENGGDASVDLRRCALYRSALSAPACGGRRVPVPPRTNNNAHELTRWAHLRPWGGRPAAARRVPTRAAVRGAVSQRPPPEFPSTPAPTESSLSLLLIWRRETDFWTWESVCVCASRINFCPHAKWLFWTLYWCFVAAGEYAEQFFFKVKLLFEQISLFSCWLGRWWGGFFKGCFCLKTFSLWI